jgi:hypothetical protein
MKAALGATLILSFVHSWYDQDCCSDRDCRPVPCEEISNVAGGWIWRHGGWRIYFDKRNLRVSQDDGCHVCIITDDNSVLPRGNCIYLPVKT